MKRSLTAAVFIICCMGAMAQPVSKKGELYLPEKGNWALGIDASPFLKYIGNFFSEAENAAPSPDFLNTNMAITGKYFKTDDFAWRASARLGVLSETNRSFSPEFSTEPTNTTVDDKYTRTFVNVYASYGVEKRKGNTRVQGFYGVEGGLGFGTETHKFDYGNGITQENTTPQRSEFMLDFQNDPTEFSNITEEGAFVTEYKMGSAIKLGARAFVGAEVFLFPKWSVGFEYGFGISYNYIGNNTVTTEQWTTPVGGTSEQFVTTVTDTGGSSAIRIDNDLSGGALFMYFYF